MTAIAPFSWWFIATAAVLWLAVVVMLLRAAMRPGRRADPLVVSDRDEMRHLIVIAAATAATALIILSLSSLAQASGTLHGAQGGPPADAAQLVPRS